MDAETESAPLLFWAVRCTRGCTFGGWDRDPRTVEQALSTARICQYDRSRLTPFRVPKELAAT